MTQVIIGADICPIEANRALFMAGDARGLFNDLLDEFAAADLVMANLECPLIERPTPILKTGPVFGEPSSCIRGIQQAGIDVLGLANNHILDHGPAGLQNTLACCAQAGVATVGAGANLAAAGRILVREAGGCRIGILAVAEHEFSIATATEWGANPLDPIEIVRSVKRQRSEFDCLIALVHGGDEFHVPSPRLKDTCHFLVELGAQAVVVQHSHCLGGYETYQGSHIIYGQGALVMDEAIYRDRPSFHEGFLVKLALQPDSAPHMEIIPFVQSEPAPGARKMQGERERQFRQNLEKKARAVADDAIVEAEWLKFCEERKHDYVSSLLGHNRILSKLNTRGAVERFLYSRLALLRAKNLVSCETHREAIETIFNRRLI